MSNQGISIDLGIYPWQPSVRATHDAYLVRSERGVVEPHTLRIMLSEMEPHEIQLELRYYGEHHAQLIDGFQRALHEVELAARRPRETAYWE